MLSICDFDMRFTFVVAGWAGFVHDTGVWTDARPRFKNYPHLPDGKYYLVDSGYANRIGYLAPSCCFLMQLQQNKIDSNRQHKHVTNVLNRSIYGLNLGHYFFMVFLNFYIDAIQPAIEQPKHGEYQAEVWDHVINSCTLLVTNPRQSVNIIQM